MTTIPINPKLYQLHKVYNKHSIPENATAYHAVGMQHWYARGTPQLKQCSCGAWHWCEADQAPAILYGRLAAYHIRENPAITSSLRTWYTRYVPKLGLAHYDTWQDTKAQLLHLAYEAKIKR